LVYLEIDAVELRRLGLASSQRRHCNLWAVCLVNANCTFRIGGATPIFSYCTNSNGQSVNGGIIGATFTINSSPNGEFLNPLPNPWVSPGYSTGNLQTVDILHELGHAAGYEGYSSAIVNDDRDSEQSMMNQDTVEQAAFEEGYSWLRM
jgi:hypothetical protein